MTTNTQKSSVVQIIDDTIKNISGRKLVSSSEMIDVLLDIRSHAELLIGTQVDQTVPEEKLVT